jgi:predicted Rossmann fold nucleotide-binding protein DprA/Smf involved in DNA uptake
MKVAIIGSRSITDKDFIFKYIDLVVSSQVPMDQPLTVISGGAKGVDTVAYEYAVEHGHDFILFKPYHLIDRAEPYRPRFFFTRNKQMADNADLVIAFLNPKGKSNGTRNMIDYCRKNHKPLVVLEPDEGEIGDSPTE